MILSPVFPFGLLALVAAFAALWVYRPLWLLGSIDAARSGLFAAFVLAAFAALVMVWLLIAMIFFVAGSLGYAGWRIHGACTGRRPV